MVFLKNIDYRGEIRQHIRAGDDSRMVTLRVGFLADVAVGLHGGTVMVRLGAGGELTVVCIVLAVAHVEIAAKDHITRRGPVPVSVETMAFPTTAATPPSVVLTTS
jgi:hypothetical protein